VIRGGGAASGKMIRAAPRLKVIGRSGVGYETVDIPAATERRIAVIYTPGLGARAVAEASVAYMLALVKDLASWDSRVKQGNWQSRFTSRPGDLFGSTLGIVGFGSIGQFLSRLVSPFEMKVLAYDPYVSRDRAAALGVTLTKLDELLRASDFISIHAPLTPETAGLINRESLRLVKRGAYLINLARGGLIESMDVLLEALEDGRLAGVGLDVFEPEPPDTTHPIFSMRGCLTSPHVLGTTNGSMREIFISMSQDMAAVLDGRRPVHIVNPEVLD
jgi:D-3-phosphoglycerate dehydrogenase